jgi:4-hydroxybenzoate polyprenyltransferase
MRIALGLVRAMRPQQWTKNLFVFAPLLLSQQWHMEGQLLRVAGVFVAFSLLSSGVYLMNDVADREADRQHPKKRHRPVAARELPVNVAVIAAVLLVGLTLVWTRFPPPLGFHSNGLLAVCSTYVVIQVLYTFWLKRMVIVDVMCIASGFVLRLIAGGKTGGGTFVEETPWIVVCTIFLSLFLALAKRRHEVVSLGRDAAGHRAILADYPPALLDQLIGAAAACTLVTYALYTVSRATVTADDQLRNVKPMPMLVATLPFVIFGVFRYLFLVYRRDEGGSPTSTLLRDVPILVNAALYGAVVFAMFRFAGR